MTGERRGCKRVSNILGESLTAIVTISLMLVSDVCVKPDVMRGELGDEGRLDPNANKVY